MAAAAMGVGIWVWGRWVYANVYLADDGRINDDWLTALVGLPLALALYLLVHWILRSDESASCLRVAETQETQVATET